MRGFLSALFRHQEEGSPDKLGLFPLIVNVEAFPERRYLWTSRLLVIIAALSMSLTIALASSIYLLLPQRSARPRVLEANVMLSQLELIEPAIIRANQMDLITEQHIEKYIKLRHTIPKVQSNLYSIWLGNRTFYWLSSRPVFQEFADKMTIGTISSFIQKGITREVEVEWAKRMTQTFWQVQFHTVTHQRGVSKPQVTIWRAYVRFMYEKTLPEDKEYLEQNPFGFKVVGYSLSYLGSPDKPESYLDTAKQIREQNYRY